ncbi:hypothetical protein TrVFT333_003904 [Trichoderma virens FT-333]|nr:hypothetical protein TrVFT333_003904 [Trichoderma virens FT-333]
MRHVRRLYPTLAAESHSLDQDALVDQMSRSDLNVIKMVFAIAMAMEGSDHEDTAEKLHASIQHDVGNTIWAATAEIGDLHVLILVLQEAANLDLWAMAINIACDNNFDISLFQDVDGDVDLSHFLLSEYELGPMWADLDIA